MTGSLSALTLKLCRPIGDSCMTSWFCLRLLALPPFKIRHKHKGTGLILTSESWISLAALGYTYTPYWNYAFTHRCKLSNSRTNLRLQSVNQVYCKTTTSQVNHWPKKKPQKTFLSVENDKHISEIVNYERYKTLMSECQACIVNAWQHHIFHLNIRSRAQHQWDTISVVVNLPPQR